VAPATTLATPAHPHAEQRSSDHRDPHPDLERGLREGAQEQHPTHRSGNGCGEDRDELPPGLEARPPWMRDHYRVAGSIPIDSEGRSPFRAAVESKDFARVQEALSPDVHFRSPVVFAPYDGRESVGALLRVVGDVLAPELVYQWQVREGDREVLCFTSRVGDRDVEGVDLLRYDEAGQVAELVVMMRPASGLAAVRDAMAAALRAAAAGA
jgi:hypothetical protein